MVKLSERKQRAALQVDGESRTEPLRDCVRSAMLNYFQHLDGHSTSNLYDLVMSEVEAPLLEMVLEHTGGNQTRAAFLLGMNRGTLRKKIKDYKLG